MLVVGLPSSGARRGGSIDTGAGAGTGISVGDLWTLDGLPGSIRVGGTEPGFCNGSSKVDSKC